MLSLNARSMPRGKTPAWLARIYAYVGADANPHRYENERDRAIQRVGMPIISVIWVVGFQQISGTRITVWEAGLVRGDDLLRRPVRRLPELPARPPGRWRPCPRRFHGARSAGRFMGHPGGAGSTRLVAGPDPGHDRPGRPALRPERHEVRARLCRARRDDDAAAESLLPHPLPDGDFAGADAAQHLVAVCAAEPVARARPRTRHPERQAAIPARVAARQERVPVSHEP